MVFLRVLHLSVIFSYFLSLVHPIESKAILDQQNQTMRYYVFPIARVEGESIQRRARQDPPSAGAPALPPAGTAINVANILTGLFQEDVRPIVSGGTAFIPAGDLREGVTGLLQGLAPALQQILFGTNSYLPPVDLTISTAAPIPRTEPPTSPRPRRRRTTTLPPVENSLSSSPSPEDGSEEETEAPPESSSQATIPSTSDQSDQLSSTTSSEYYDEDTEPPTSSASPASATSPLPPSPQQVSNSAAENIVSGTPDTLQVAQSIDLTQSPMTTPRSTVSGAAQLKVILEDSNSIVTANVINSVDGEEKQYIYLVLLPDQYNQLTKNESNSQQQMSVQINETAEIPKIEHLNASQDNLALIIATSTTLKSIRYNLRNRNRSTTMPPPHLQLQFYRQSSGTTTTTTTTTVRTTSTDLPGVKGFEIDDDELEIRSK